MTTELSSKPTLTRTDDNNVSDNTLTKQYPVINRPNQKSCENTDNSAKLHDLQVVLPKLEATNIVPLAGGIGFSVQPHLSATINPLNKTHIPGVGNYPARKSKRNADALSCCLGCTTGNVCKGAKSSEEQRKHKCDKNVAEKRKYVKRKGTTVRKVNKKVTSDTEMSPLSMVHQYMFNQETSVSEVSSDAEAPAQNIITEGMINGPTASPLVFSSASSTAYSRSEASGNSLAMANSSTFPSSGAACLGIVPSMTHFIPNPPTATNTGIASLHQTRFPALPPLPLRQPYVSAIPVYAAPNLCPFYLPPVGQHLQTGIPFIPAAHNMMCRPPIHSLMQYCNLPLENNCGQTLTDVASSCFNFAPFELQTQCGEDCVDTCSISGGHPEEYDASCNTIVGQPNDHIATCSTSVEHQKDNVGTGSRRPVHQKDHAVSSSTSVGHHRNHINTSSTSTSTTTSTSIGHRKDHVGSGIASVGHQKSCSNSSQHQSDNQTMFSISSLLPEGRGKFRLNRVLDWSMLKTVLGQVTKRDIADYAWLIDECDVATISGVSSLKKFIERRERVLDYDNYLLQKSCVKLQQVIDTYQNNINKDTERHEKVAWKLRAANKRGVKQMEAELNELLIKLKVLFDDTEGLEEKWFFAEGTFLVANSIFKQNFITGESKKSC